MIIVSNTFHFPGHPFIPPWVNRLVAIQLTVGSCCWRIANVNAYGCTMTGVWLMQPMAWLSHAGFLQLFIFLRLFLVWSWVWQIKLHPGTNDLCCRKAQQNYCHLTILNGYTLQLCKYYLRQLSFICIVYSVFLITIAGSNKNECFYY